MIFAGGQIRAAETDIKKATIRILLRMMAFYCSTSIGLYLSLLNYGVNRQILIGPYLDSLNIVLG